MSWKLRFLNLLRYLHKIWTTNIQIIYAFVHPKKLLSLKRKSQFKKKKTLSKLLELADRHAKHSARPKSPFAETCIKQVSIHSSILFFFFSTPVFLSGKSHGQESLTGYSPWGCKESDMIKRLKLSSFFL